MLSLPAKIMRTTIVYCPPKCLTKFAEVNKYVSRARTTDLMAYMVIRFVDLRELYMLIRCMTCLRAVMRSPSLTAWRSNRSTTSALNRPATGVPLIAMISSPVVHKNIPQQRSLHFNLSERDHDTMTGKMHVNFRIQFTCKWASLAYSLGNYIISVRTPPFLRSFSHLATIPLS